MELIQRLDSIRPIYQLEEGRCVSLGPPEYVYTLWKGKWGHSNWGVALTLPFPLTVCHVRPKHPSHLWVQPNNTYTLSEGREASWWRASRCVATVSVMMLSDFFPLHCGLMDEWRRCWWKAAICPSLKMVGGSGELGHYTENLIQTATHTQTCRV